MTRSSRLDPAAKPPAGGQSADDRQEEEHRHADFDADHAAHEKDQAEGDAQKGRAHLDGNEFLCSHRSGQARLQEIRVNSIDLTRRIEARQVFRTPRAAGLKIRLTRGSCTRSMGGAVSTYSSASEPSDRMKSSRLEVLCDRQAAVATPARPIAIKVIPTNGANNDALTRPLPFVSHLDVDHAAYDPEAQGHESGRPDENDQARRRAPSA